METHKPYDTTTAHDNTYRLLLDEGITGHIATIARVVVDLILDDGKLRGHECFRGALEVEAVAFCQRVVKTVGTESLDSELISAQEPSSIINVKRTSKVDAGAKVWICSAASLRLTRWTR